MLDASLHAAGTSLDHFGRLDCEAGLWCIILAGFLFVVFLGRYE